MGAKDGSRWGLVRKVQMVPSDAPLQMGDTRLETFHDLANAAHLVELDLKLVDFAQNGTEACDFRVGRLDRVTGAVVLDLRRRLGLLRELAREPLAAVCDCSAQGAPGVTGK